jgi:hypothetical protein
MESLFGETLRVPITPQDTTNTKSERRSGLLDAIPQSAAFAVRWPTSRPATISLRNDAIVEPESVGDLEVSLVDGRLFPQVVRLADGGYRSLLLIEGSPPTSLPDVNPHSIEGALVSIAAMWRLPVLHASVSEQSPKYCGERLQPIQLGPHDL